MHTYNYYYLYIIIIIIIVGISQMQNNNVNITVSYMVTIYAGLFNSMSATMYLLHVLIYCTFSLPFNKHEHYSQQ